MDVEKYQFTRDFFLVWVDQIWESSKTKSGIITSNTAIHNTNEEVEDRGEYKRRYGTVLQVPASYSENQVYMIEPILPQPRAYVGHDFLQSMRNIGQRGYREHEDARKKYYPSTYERIDTYNMSEYARHVDAKVGEKVYFLHTSTDMERYMGKYKNGHLFAVEVQEILCVVREDKVFAGYGKYKQKRIYPQGHWVFVELNMESWEDILLPGTDIMVKVAPEARPLEGRVVASRNKEIEGKTVLFEREADAPIRVEGRDLTCMESRDILATLKTNL